MRGPIIPASYLSLPPLAVLGRFRKLLITVLSQCLDVATLDSTTVMVRVLACVTVGFGT
jgi:hypothetical protein